MVGCTWSIFNNILRLLNICKITFSFHLHRRLGMSYQKSRLQLVQIWKQKTLDEHLEDLWIKLYENLKKLYL